MRTALINARNNAGLTQEAMARELGITKVTYQTYEYGTRNGSTDIWIKIFNLFGRKIPLHELMEKYEESGKEDGA